MADSVVYRVFVFDANDKCVQYKEIKAGAEGKESNELKLTDGTYAFLAYSYNSTASMPAYTDPTGKSIGDDAFNFTVSPLVANGGGDLLYAKNRGVSISSATTTVALTFVHKFNKVKPVGTTITISDNDSAYYMDGATLPFYVNRSDTATIVEYTGTVTSYETARLIFNTTSTTAANTELTNPGNLTTAPVSATSANGTSITSYGTNFAYLPSGTQDVQLIISDAKYNKSGTLTTATDLPKTCSFSSKAVSVGASYKLDFSFLQGGGIPLYWAKGNLKYNKDATSGVESWSFYDTQFGYNANNYIDFFEWNGLVPNPNNISKYPTGNSWDPSKDPCSKVSSTRAWRTPTYDELAAFVKMYKAVPPKVRYDRSKQGEWFGDTENTENASRYLYLPSAGYISSPGGLGGHYWSSTPIGYSTTYELYFGLTGGIWDLKVVSTERSGGMTVRCVSDPIKPTNNVQPTPNIVDESNGTLIQTN
jgi:hypothetical protein